MAKTMTRAAESGRTVFRQSMPAPSVLEAAGTHPLHEFGFREVASGTRGSALAEDENLARARRFRLPVRCMKERQDAGSKFKPRKRA